MLDTGESSTPPSVSTKPLAGGTAEQDLPFSQTDHRRDEDHSDTDSQQSQARHYHTLQEIYKRPKPNKEAVAQLLDLEFDARRAFINSDCFKDQDRPSKILQAYPCFRELHHVMDELGRILDKGNPRFIPKLKARWESFCSKAQFYGVYKKVLKPPMNLDGVKRSIALMKALPEMFPSPLAPPKKMGHASEAMLHILEPTENPDSFLKGRPLFSPVLIVSEDNCMLAIGTTPVTTFPQEDLHEDFLWNVEEDFREVPESWIPAHRVQHENGHLVPDEHGHIPGWFPVDGTNKQYCWHASLDDYPAGVALVLRVQEKDEGLLEIVSVPLADLMEQTLELIGTNVNGNPYGKYFSIEKT
ncbi:hypothetical protein E1301_Tti023202 [Triplophysa tibetana]|uniref:RNA ligase 1 n=1 Tax=Triplophysa tibetana TaxID=1572043 RepID=A0A5A9N7Z1_9TELE|nr:hypothetical protein E1301_Tti023202 [Triplophysa tibetana]